MSGVARLPAYIGDTKGGELKRKVVEQLRKMKAEEVLDLVRRGRHTRVEVTETQRSPTDQLTEVLVCALGRRCCTLVFSGRLM